METLFDDPRLRQQVAQAMGVAQAAQPMAASAIQSAPVNPTHAMTAPLAAKPEPMGINAESAPIGSTKKSPLDAIEQGAESDREKLREQKARPFGFKGAGPSEEFPNGLAANHPGFWGKTGHVLAKIGNIAGDIVAPGTMALIPGTDFHRQLQERGLGNEIQGIEKQRSEQNLQGAQAGHLTQETNEMPANDEAERGLKDAQTDVHRESLSNPSLASGYAHAVNEALKAGRDPSTDPIVQHLGDAITGLQKQAAPKGRKNVNLQDEKHNPYAASFDEATGKYYDTAGNEIAKPVPYEKPTSVNVNAGEGRKEKTEILKQYQPSMDSAERFNVMAKNYEDAIKNHDQQAMLSLLANHLGMTMGLQKGSRLTKDIINEAKQSRPWLEGMKSKFDSNGYLTGVTLTPAQMKQMVDLGRGRFTEDTTKARNNAKYLGDTGDGPERTPNRSTINHYTALANGDPEKAKQLAAQDGWTIK